jgi:Arc/MetJ family transcription regulator
MKRTNLVLDERLIEEVLRLSGQRTYSAAVTLALEEFVRRVRARRILTLAGSGAWAGDLGAMRRDGHAVTDRARPGQRHGHR